MQVPLELDSRNVEIPDDFVELLRRGVRRLERLHPRIVRCRVTVHEPHRTKRTGRECMVRLELTTPDGACVVTRQQGDTWMTAAQRAFAAAQRRLQDATGRTRRQLKTDTPP